MTRSGEVEELVVERVRHAYAERETTFTPPVMRHLERIIWLQTLDNLWRDHLLSMDHLKEGIGLRGYGQKNPLQEYQKEGYDLFEELIRRMEADVVEKLMSVQLQAQPAAAQAHPAASPILAPSEDFDPAMPAAVADMQRRQQQRAPARVRLSHGEAAGGSQKVETVRRDAEKVGRNDPCPCGSGKKYKKCHGLA
jgi:preprotein translocase subunit SecA